MWAFKWADFLMNRPNMTFQIVFISSGVRTMWASVRPYFTMLTFYMSLEYMVCSRCCIVAMWTFPLSYFTPIALMFKLDVFIENLTNRAGEWTFCTLELVCLLMFLRYVLLQIARVTC